MKQQLRQIFEDLSTGRISRGDALERIKAIRRQERQHGHGTLLFAPTWRDAVIPHGGPATEAAEHHILLCDLPPLPALRPHVQSVTLPAPAQASIADRYADVALTALERIQSIFRRKPHGRVLLQIVVPDDDEHALLAGISGLLKTAALENPQFIGQIVLVPRDATTDVLAHWLQSELRGGTDAVVRYGRGVRQVLQWEEVAVPSGSVPLAFQDRGVYLITGGLGSLGTLFAKEILARTSEARVLLTGRTEVSAGWFTQSSRVTYRQVDLADARQVEELVASIVREHGRLDGILHCAGMIADDFILRKSASDFRQVLEPKVAGTVHLDRATRDVPLDFFVLFSSIAAAVGNPGQSDYAAANSFMDWFAVHRNALAAAGQRHGRTRSVEWPLWEAGGMTLDPALQERWRQTTGVRPLQTATGFSAFHRILALPHDRVLVVDGHIAEMRRAFLDHRRSKQPERAAEPAAPQVDRQGMEQKTEEFLRNEFAEILKLPPQKIDPQAALEQYGIDSILAMRLTGQLEKTFGSLSKTLFFEYQSVRELAAYFVESHAGRLAELFAERKAETPPAAPAKETPVWTRRSGRRRAGDAAPAATGDTTASQHEPIAIVGLSGRYPQAPDLEAYWKNLRDGKDCVTEVPRDRWDWREYFTDDRTKPGSHYSKWGGFITGVDEFDPLFFNISPKEAKYIDPQERLFLQHAWMAVEDAGYTRASLQIPSQRDLPAQVGVYVGVMYNEYQLFGAEASVRGKRIGIPASVASIANRVSYVLNLHGPSMTVDTMCSSSLTAIHLACQDLRQGRTNLAIAGGVNVTIHPNKYLALSSGQFISSDGHCQSFGEGGDGYIPGEGVGVVVLKRLSDARRDGDHIYAVIRGSSINHGGKTNGFTVPNPKAQAAAIARALADASTDPRHISYIEAHGTGTKLGDPIEIAALTKAFQHSTGDTGFCLIGSAKSNIGHCESAAGIAGLTKVLLQLQHQEIVPSLHSARLNPHIDFERTPFVVNQTLRPWEQPVVEGRTLPRIAGISSFGAGGSNAHLVVEEYRLLRDAPVQTADVAIVLSARTAAQLQQKARDLAEFVRARRSSIDLLSLAYTLQVGREAMDERLAFAATSIDDVLEKLDAIVAGNGNAAGVVQGRRAKEAQQPGDGGDLRTRIERWVKGAEVEWQKLYDMVPRRISLPTYPFARERYWIDDVPPAQEAATPVLHPLLHANTSDLVEQRYSSTFRGNEPFLVERGGRKALPAVASLEMARAAVERALPEAPAVLELRDVTWTAPLFVEANEPVSIALFAGGDDAIEFEIFSGNGEEAILHCHGSAVVARDARPAPLAGAQLLARVQTEEARDWVLHPAVESALAAIAPEGALTSVASVRIFGACAGEVVAWSRANDLDLRDAQGNVRVELRGLRYAAPATAEVAAPQPREIASEEVAPQRTAVALAPAPQPREIALDDVAPKRTAIALAAPGEAPIAPAPRAPRPTIRLSNAGSRDAAVRLHDRGNGVFAIELAAPATAARLRQALDRAQQEESLRVLTIRGLEHAPIELANSLAAFPYPVIAVAGTDTIGAGFLLAALCDFVVCSEEARYGYADDVTPAGAALLAERFGHAQAHELLHVSRTCTGRELRAKGWSCPIVAAAEVEAHANELAASLASKSPAALKLLGAHLSRRVSEAARALTRLDAPAQRDAHAFAFSATQLRVQVREEGVAVVTAPSFDEAAVAELERLFAEARSCRSVVLQIPKSVPAELRRVIAGSPVPVIAALPEGADGSAWVTALLCEAAVHARTASYSAAGLAGDAALAPLAAELFPLRFGQAGRELLLTGATWTGAELERRVGAVTVVAPDDVLATAVTIAATWTHRHAPRVEELPASVQEQESASPEIVAPTPIALQSPVVRATAHPGGIVVVRMEDREAKNMFSAALIEGLEEAFAQVEANPAYKVVVLTGYDHYFASGGTKETLLAIQAGNAKFTDARTFRLPFDCTLPVIAAMQGHGIGAGWSLGMFADLAILGEESRYVSPYMEYGFTPGAGATWSLPARLGNDLAWESLLTARPVTGLALKSRGLTLPVVPRAEVERAAMALAQQIARTPRHQLVALKRQWTAAAREAVDDVLRRELAMHDVTFVGQNETLQRIEKSFAEEATPVQPAPAQAPRATADTLASVAATLRTLLANELQLQESDIDDDAQFIDLGLDSISGVSWIRKINERYRTSIEATRVYSHPTLTALSRYVHAEAEAQGSLPVVQESAPAAEPAPQPERAPQPEPEPVPVVVATAATPAPRRRRRASRANAAAPQRARRAEPIAIIGMAGQFPRARNLEEYWRNLAEGRDCIVEVPRERWNIDAYYQAGGATPGKTNSRWVGALDEYDRFDPLFFNISPTEAECMDPQQRLFLQACWHSIEHAGYDASTLSGSKCGVFVGCATGDYQELSRRHRLSAQGFTGNATSILAARISYFLNLQGPCVSIDTACSSSLVAIAQACDSLQAGDSDLALAGGVYVMAGPEMHIRTAQAGMLSPEGRCFTFDQRADGFVPGEGVGVVVLKRLADAERDGDVIYGVVEGWGVNQDGRTNGITAPNPESQTRLMLDVYEKFAIDPAGIQLIEAHGTGTKLGDPIEVEGLKAAFGRHTSEKRYCAIGSVKSNIGHSLTAAGVAGTLKLVLALQHRQLPPTIHFERMNEHIDLSDSPFFVNTRLEPWKTKEATPRRAAISSFGFSGTNAHVVVGEYRPAVEIGRAAEAGPVLVPLSAKTPAGLQQKARDLVAFLRDAAQPPRLADVAYTLQVGREAMDERVAFVVRSVAELTDKLQAWLDGRAAGDVWQGQARRKKETLAEGERNFATIAAEWVRGVVVDWKTLYDQPLPRRIALPLYPFAKERYWIDAPGDEARNVAVLHPLLHANVSDLGQTRFRSTFDGTEPFLVERSLPAAACLELARAAVEQALPERPDGATLELRDVTWGQRLVVDGSTDVFVALLGGAGDAVDFEIYSAAGEREIVHCRGRAALRTDVEAAPRVAGTQFRLPPVDGAGDYVLHPAVLDAALRGAAPAGVPVKLDALRIFGACSGELVAWVRGDGSRLDVDLCDARGDVRVELRGLLVYALGDAPGRVLAVPRWQASAPAASAATDFAERHVLLCELPRIDAAQLASLLPRTLCTSLDAADGDIARRYSDYAVASFERIQSIVAAKAEGRVLVQIVIPDGDEQSILAGLSGLLRTAALEHARLSAQLLIVPSGITIGELHALLRDEQGLAPLVRFTGGTRQVPRWEEVAEAQEAPVAFRENGVYLLTGGLGALGLLFAREILERTRNARVVLTGRAADARVDALAPHLDRVSYRSLDLGNFDSVRQLVSDVVAEHGRLDGVLHCAGMTADNFLARKSSDEFAAVLAPKVTGTFHLDEATRDVALDFFVLFSSIASAVGNAGQADYAAANGFMDHFAAWRNRQVAAGQRHGRTRAINWSLWQAGGMSVDRATQELVQQTIGVQPMRTATGLQAFHHSLAVACDQMLVAEGERAQIRAYLQKARLFESAPAEEAPRQETAAAISLTDLQQQLRTAVATVLRIEPSLIDLDRPFAEFGLDSFLGAELIVAINKRYGTELSHSRLFDYATVRELAAFLEQELRSAKPAAAAPALPAPKAALPVLERTLRGRRGTPARALADDRIAIIGMSGRYPQAGDLKEYWSNLAAGKNSIVEVPASRWDVERYYDPDRTRKDKTYSRWLGAIDDVDRFDPLFFRISPQEAEYIDPQHRLFLQESYRAFEDAGYSTATLGNRKCGVYLGITTNEYMSMLAKKGILGAPVTSNSYAIAAARIAYYLNLKGPAISVDTACSSSLVAIHLACQALLNGEIDMALAGGVTLWLTPDSYVAMSQAGMFSPDGQCKTFDDSANGIVNGEGVGAVVLKRLRDAEAAGDTIYGVILGSGINQDGRTNGITAPSVNSQIELERSVYEKHGIDPETISYIETHGTGTKLGDPIELEALSTVFKEKTSRRNFCALGSVKSNIGHTTAAAGVAGLQKVLLSMRHRTLVPTLNVSKENSRFDFAGSPFYVSRETKPWEAPEGAARRAAVSSFGFSGTNAHLVVEEYRPPVSAPAAAGPAIVPLSARTPEQLQQKARDLLAFVRNTQEPLDLTSIAWTLQVGREAMEERLGIVASSVSELTEKLDAWIRGQKAVEGVVRGHVEPDNDAMTIIAHDDDMREAIERWIARRKLGPLVDLWVRGLDFDWSRLHADTKPRRISLPTYPFAKERCWIDADARPAADSAPLLAEDVKAVEQIIDRIANDTIEPEQAVQTLRMLV